MSEADRLRVFISYRREDCLPQANLLAASLRFQADAEALLDIDSIPPGVDFRKYIDKEVSSCDVVVVMIGDDWLSAVGPDARPRISSPTDWVRLEVKAALDRDIRVIPALVEGAPMPRPEDLPEDIRELSYRNAARLSDESWSSDFRALADSLPRARQSSPSEVPMETSSAKARRPTAPKPPSRPIDRSAAERFIESIPLGHWTSYGDVARAAGSPKAGMAIGEWLRREGEQISNVWRVLQSTGAVSEGWSPTDPRLPRTSEDVRQLLRSEGLSFDAAGRADPAKRWRAGSRAGSTSMGAASPITRTRTEAQTDVVIVAAKAAYPDYLGSCSYVCQPGRSFRPGLHRLGFYSARQIQPVIPSIRHRRDGVLFTSSNAEDLRASGGPFDAEVADLIDKSLDPFRQWSIRRTAGENYQVFLLSDPRSKETLQLGEPIRHNGLSAWTQGQRYLDSASLARGAPTTEDL